MKKIYNLLLTMLLIGCSNKDNTPYDLANLSILCPTGAPSIAFYNYYNLENFETNATPKNIVAAMTENGNDVIVIDTITGLKAIASGAPYKLASNITFGNFYLAATGNDDNGKLDKDDNIISFGKGQTPELCFNLIYGDDYNVTYLDAVANAAKCLISGVNPDTKEQVDYVFVAEPVLTNALAKNTNASIYANIQDEYYNKTGKGMIQAGVFIKNGLDSSITDAFLNNLKENINALIANPNLLTETFTNITDDDISLKYGIGSALMIKTLNKNNAIGLGFKYAKENREDLDYFANLFSFEIEDSYIY